MRPLPAAALCLALLSCGRPADTRLNVDEAWVQPPVVSGRPGTAYFTIRGGNVPVRMIGIASPRVERIELHESRMEGGLMKMEPLATLPIPEGGTLTFAPGGRHAMLFGLDAALRPGDRIPLTFSFDSAPALTVAAEVRAIGAEDY